MYVEFLATRVGGEGCGKFSWKRKNARHQSSLWQRASKQSIPGIISFSLAFFAFLLYTVGLPVFSHPPPWLQFAR